uniref:Receptor like protein 25 n=1 Tax=Elaeis guineensis var. tenera TaxID=51953 RepID=A0A8N4EY20_ELAGV|nr:putative receptor like protein 25 [Elaeis guineensis]
MPGWFFNISSLEYLNLKGNSLQGTISPAIKNLASLNFLDLSSNPFVGGKIPVALDGLYLVHNSLSGTIPSSFGEFTSMKVFQVQDIHETILDVFTIGYNDKMHRTFNGRDFEFVRVLAFVNAMDLSDNNLSRAIPEELTNLFGLLVLNLSRNHLSGEITKKIDALQQLELLDLSSNDLFGGIPSSMKVLTFLSYLNLLYNNLLGRVLFGDQLQTLMDPSIYAGNLGLCGFPLTQECKVDEHEMKWLNMCIGAGFATGFWVVFGPLLFNEKMERSLFSTYRSSV